MAGCTRWPMANDKRMTNRRIFPSRTFFSCVPLTQLRANWCTYSKGVLIILRNNDYRLMQWTDSSTVLQSRPLNARMKGKVYGSPCTTMHTMHNLRSRKKRRKTFVNLVPRVPLKKATKKASWSNLSGRYNTSPLSPPLSVTIRDSPFEKLRGGGRIFELLDDLPSYNSSLCSSHILWLSCIHNFMNFFVTFQLYEFV